MAPYSFEVRRSPSDIFADIMRSRWNGAFAQTIKRITMPIYEYQFEACEHKLEKLQKIADEPLKVCPSCDEPALNKLISAAGFRLSGGGWYETDFKTGNKKNVSSSDSSTSNSGSSGDSSSGSSSSSSGSSSSNDTSASAAAS